MNSNSNNNVCNYKEIYDLLEKLCKNFVSTKHSEILKHVAQYISNTPTAFNSSMPYDETTLVSKICSHISKSSSTNDVMRFMNLHEQLRACQDELQKRTAILTFLLLLAETPASTNSNGLSSIRQGSKSLTGATTTTNRQQHQTSLNSIVYSFRQSILPGLISQYNNSNNNNINNNNTNSNSNSGQMPSDNKLPESFQNNKNFGFGQISSELATIKANYLQQQSDSSSSSSPRGGASSTHIKSEIGQDLNGELVQNAIYAFTGIEGKYLKKDVISGGFKLDSKARTLTIVQASMLVRLSDLGYYHDQVQSFTDIKSGKNSIGLIGQGFMSALRNELTKYYGMVAMLHEQLNKSRYNEIQDRQSNNRTPERVTLMKLMVWAVDPLHRLQWLTTIAEDCQEKKGGALASVIYEYLGNGDPNVKSLVRELLVAVCDPLQQMLSRWILEGEIIDPHCEFFIECLSDVAPDRLWHDKYRVRTSMLPTFISTELANKILITGKSINFLREICQDKTPIEGREELRYCLETNSESIFSDVADTKLHTMIDTVYLSTSKKVLDIAMGPHKLLEHLQAMRRYLLLGQGDFIGILMENLKSELDKPGKELYCYDLSSILDAAIRSTNAQYDDPEILNHLDVRLLNPYDGDSGWDILSLNYTVRGPLSTILEPSMNNYLMLFRPLWRMKHIEYLLSSKIWRDQMCNAKPLRFLGHNLNPVMYRLHLYTSEMIHLINQMQYYILFEVIECSWAAFQEKVQQAKTLDDILHAHNDFLETIKIGAFLDKNSEEISSHMENLYLCITRLEIWQDKFFDACFKELKLKKDYEDQIKESEKLGKYGITTEKRLQRDEEEKMFEQYVIISQKSLEKIGNDFEISVRQFLLSLNSNNDPNLQLFGTRLDFNEYYKKRDQRLGVPLTFEHMRQSNIFFGNKSLTGSRYSSTN